MYVGIATTNKNNIGLFQKKKQTGGVEDMMSLLGILKQENVEIPRVN